MKMLKRYKTQQLYKHRSVRVYIANLGKRSDATLIDEHLVSNLLNRESDGCPYPVYVSVC